MTYYTWPNPALPFRLYFNNSKCRIFIIHNITHNYEWLKEVRNYVKPTDFFFVTLAWYFDKYLASQVSTMFSELNLNQSQFYVMYNELDEMMYGRNCGMRGDIVNHNAFLDEGLYYIEPDTEKLYNAVYIARRTEFKRHHLANNIDNLALVAGGCNHAHSLCGIPPCLNDPHEQLDTSGIRRIINQSRVSLCLSEIEGANWSSGESLLCGVPVVSTPNQGGRSSYLNITNSKIVNDDPVSVKTGVDSLIDKNFSPVDIRNDFLQKQLYFREVFKRELYNVLSENKVEIDVDEYFENNFINRMYNSQHIDDIIKTFTHE